MPELADTARLRDLIPRPGETGQLPARRDQRRAPPRPAAPAAAAEDPSDPGGERPHIDEYV